MPSTLSASLLYIATGVNVISVFGHTQMGFKDYFPALKPLGKSQSAGVFRTGWMEVNITFVTMAILCLKWAQTGTDSYEKALLACCAVGQAFFGLQYTRLGLYSPIVALWLAPGLAVASQLV